MAGLHTAIDDIDEVELHLVEVDLVSQSRGECSDGRVGVVPGSVEAVIDHALGASSHRVEECGHRERRCGDANRRRQRPTSAPVTTAYDNVRLIKRSMS